MTRAFLACAILVLGCDARFENLRSGLDSQDAAQPDTGAVPDAGVVPDAGAGQDAGPGDEPTVIGEGEFEGRTGYDASGGVRVEQTGPQSYQVVLGDDFASAAVPGPVLVVSGRDRLGTALVSEDILVTRLSRDQIRGAGTYTFETNELPGNTHVYVYCEPFGVETARARLELR
ncbi:MAG: hypothetical protein AAGE52_24775 [Myxococcota bacterium]